MKIEPTDTFSNDQQHQHDHNCLNNLKKSHGGDIKAGTTKFALRYSSVDDLVDVTQPAELTGTV
jgi:hypothetical protein